MGQAQRGVAEESYPHGLFIIFNVVDPAQNGPAAAKICAGLPSMKEAVGKLDPGAGLSGTVSFGSDFWDLISPDHRPKYLQPFRTIGEKGRQAPATGGDILFHMTSTRLDLIFELGRRMAAALGDYVRVFEEVPGFTYLDSRDLTGFIDGSANPKGDERADAALIGGEDEEFKGGSYVLTQRYVHDLEKWAGLAEGEQEKTIGRTKKDSTELGETEKPETAHISRVEVEEDGEELKIVRHSLPYGRATG